MAGPNLVQTVNHTLWVEGMEVVFSLLLLGLAPADPSVGRDVVIRAALRVATLGSGTAAAVAAVTLCTQARLLGRPLEVDADPLAAQLRSATGLEARDSRRKLEIEWRALRKEPADRARTLEAFETVLRTRRTLDAAEELVRSSKLRELPAALPPQLIGELEAAATVLASSAVLSREAREAVGWQWGACGWRQCGAQADAAQALWKLRSNMGMIVPMEALFYLDVAKRSLDEVLAAGVGDGWLPSTAVGERHYLPLEQLEMILPPEDLQSGDANLPVIRGGLTEAEESLEDSEAALMAQLEGLSSGASSDEDAAADDAG